VTNQALAVIIGFLLSSLVEWRREWSAARRAESDRKRELQVDRAAFERETLLRLSDVILERESIDQSKANAEYLINTEGQLMRLAHRVDDESLHALLGDGLRFREAQERIGYLLRTDREERHP